ncbi:MAG: hypothetical protein AB7N71_00615 [Phycisphaerae bacterium]
MSPVCDMNCNGIVSVSDIAGFVLAHTDPTGDASHFPVCDLNNADANNDGIVSVSDIGAFVNLLTSGRCQTHDMGARYARQSDSQKNRRVREAISRATSLTHQRYTKT